MLGDNNQKITSKCSRSDEAIGLVAIKSTYMIKIQALFELKLGLVVAQLLSCGMWKFL